MVPSLHPSIVRTWPVSFRPGAGGVIESDAFSQANGKGSKLGPWDPPGLLPLVGEPAPDPQGCGVGRGAAGRGESCRGQVGSRPAAGRGTAW